MEFFFSRIIWYQWVVLINTYADAEYTMYTSSIYHSTHDSFPIVNLLEFLFSLKKSRENCKPIAYKIDAVSRLSALDFDLCSIYEYWMNSDNRRWSFSTYQFNTISSKVYIWLKGTWTILAKNIFANLSRKCIKISNLCIHPCDELFCLRNCLRTTTTSAIHLQMRSSLANKQKKKKTFLVRLKAST